MTMKPLKKRCLSDVDITAIAVFLTLTSLGDHLITVYVGFAFHNCCIAASSQALKSPDSLLCLFYAKQHS
jgi:hypothetical protein